VLVFFLPRGIVPAITARAARAAAGSRAMRPGAAPR
jgi:hypothetical protein